MKLEILKNPKIECAIEVGQIYRTTRPAAPMESNAKIIIHDVVENNTSGFISSHHIDHDINDKNYKLIYYCYSGYNEIFRRCSCWFNPERVILLEH